MVKFSFENLATILFYGSHEKILFALSMVARKQDRRQILKNFLS